MVEEKGLRVYSQMSRLPFPRSYSGKLLLAAFLGIHVPLIALVLYLLALSPPIGFGTKLGVFTVVLVATLLGTCATLFVLYLLLKPVSMASEALRGYLEDGKMPALPTGFTDRAGKLMADVQHAVEHLDGVIRSLEERSATDYLTGVYTRRAGEEHLAQDLARAERSGSVLTLALIDIDQFKPINDRHGHQAGDACLRHVASVLRRNARKGDWVARWGETNSCWRCGTREGGVKRGGPWSASPKRSPKTRWSCREAKSSGSRSAAALAAAHRRQRNRRGDDSPGGPSPVPRGCYELAQEWLANAENEDRPWTEPIEESPFQCGFHPSS